MPTQKLLERKALIVGIVINVLQVLAGRAVFFMTGLKAMFLDFSFTAISVLSGDQPCKKLGLFGVTRRGSPPFIGTI